MAWSDRPGAAWRLPEPSGEVVTTRHAECPRFRITTEDHGGGEFNVTARLPTGKRAGYISLWRADRHLNVMASKVYEPYQRCGLGTKLYERAARLACEKGVTLASDDKRSVASDSFWRKQVAKGRARCVREAPEAEYASRTRDIATNRSGCEYYELTQCPPGDLSGRHGNARPRSVARRPARRR